MSRKQLCLALSIPFPLLALRDRGTDEESVLRVLPSPRSFPAAPSARAPHFVANRGQWHSSARFAGKLGATFVRVEADAIALQLHEGRERPERGVLVRMVFEGASPHAWIEGEDQREALYSFFLGNDPKAWVGGASSFDAVRYHDLYTGIDLVLHARNQKLEYDLHVSPGADVSEVRVRIEGADGLCAGEQGGLSISTGLGDLLQAPARCFQVTREGEEKEVLCTYRIVGEHTFGFELGAHDPTLSVILDPELLWSTYLGSSVADAVGDYATGVAVDPDGDVYVTGWATGTNFPLTPGAFSQANPAGWNIFATRLRGSDGALLYSCTIGGTILPGSTTVPDQRSTEIRVDAQSRATVAGWTRSSDFPTTPGAYLRQTPGGGGDAFVFRLSPLGDQLVYSTLLGGSWTDQAYALALAPSGAAIVGGLPTSLSSGADFPTTPGTLSPGYTPFTLGFITRLDPTGSFLEWSTLFDADVFEIALDQDESVVVTGKGGTVGSVQPTRGAWAPPPPASPDAQVYVARLEPAGNALRWVSVFGGTYADAPEGLALDAHGGPVIVGSFDGTGPPATPGAFQTIAFTNLHNGFVVRLNPDGGGPVYSTYFGAPAEGVGLTRAFDVATDASGVVTVGGTSGLGLATTPGAFQTIPAGSGNAFVARFSPLGDRLFYSTAIGGPGTDEGFSIAISPTRRVSIVGYSNGGYPTTANAPYTNYQGGQTDAVVTTLDLMLTGVRLHGTSTPACLGPLHLNATEMPRAGAARFALYCSAAPPLSSGWLLFGATAASPTSLPGADLWLDRSQPIVRLPVQSDGDGYVETPLPLPPGSEGRTFACQYLLRDTHACGGASSWSASNALVITVQ